MTLLLEIIFIFMLQFGGFSLKLETIYKRVGEDVYLPCNVNRSSDYDVTWLIYRRGKPGFELISCKENVDQSSARASRLSVSRNCSLLITNITDEDADLYVCRLGNNNHNDAYVFLTILSNSSSPSDVYGRVNLTCSLKSFCGPEDICDENSIIWMDETGSQLSGKNPEFEVKKQTNCVSVLTVKHQSGNNKRFTCKYVKDEEVKIDAVYVLTDLSVHNFIIIVGAVMKVVLMFVGVVAALVYMYRRRTKENEDQRTRTRRTIEEDDEHAL